MTRDHDRALADLADLLLSVARVLHVPQIDGLVHLTATETTVMRCIDRNPGVSAGRAAQVTGLQRSNLSTAVRSLESKGLVRRDADERDARSVRLHPTPLAGENLSALRAEWSRVLAEAEVPGAAIDSTIAVLGRLDAALQGAGQAPASSSSTSSRLRSSEANDASIE